MTQNKKAEVQGEQSKFKKINNNDNRQNSRRVCIIIALAVIIAVGINMLLGLIPTKIANCDISTGRIFSISEETEDMLAAVSQPVQIYYVCESGDENKNTEVMLNLYADASQNITVEKLDPSYDPQLIIKLTGETTLDSNTVIVVSGERKQVINYEDYRSGTNFVLEDYLNAALDFVLGDELRMVYTTTSHGELSVSDEIIAYMGLDGFSCQDIDLTEVTSIPDDARVVLLNGVSKDLSAKEAQILIDYLKKGGSILLATDNSTEEFTNIQKVTSYFGGTLGSGVIFETDSNRYTNDSRYYIMPSINTESEDITDGINYIVLPDSKPIVIEQNSDSSVTCDVILETAETSYSEYVNVSTGQTETTQGPFTVGVKFTKGEDGAEGEMIWVSSGHLGNTTLSETVGGGNITFMLNSICALGEDEPVDSIHGKSLSTKFLDIPDDTANLYKIIIPGIIPLVVILCGVAVLIRRKRR